MLGENAVRVPTVREARNFLQTMPFRLVSNATGRNFQKFTCW